MCWRKTRLDWIPNSPDRPIFPFQIVLILTNIYCLFSSKALLEGEKSVLEEDKALLENEKAVLEGDKVDLQAEAGQLQEEKGVLEEDKVGLDLKFPCPAYFYLPNCSRIHKSILSIFL